MIENLFTLKGTLYSKDTRTVPNTKNPTEPDWEFHSIKVETNVLINGRTITAIPELALDRGCSFEGFSVGDEIHVDYYLFGKQVSKNWYKTEPKAVFIKFSSRTAPLKVEGTGKTRVPSMSDVSELENPPKTEDVFATKSPTEIAADEDNDNMSDLPF